MYSLEALDGHSASHTPDMTATPHAPEVSTPGTLSIVTPPMAITGVGFSKFMGEFARFSQFAVVDNSDVVVADHINKLQWDSTMLNRSLQSL